MKVFANARDVGPRSALEKITSELLANHSAQFVIYPQEADVVLLGMSSSPELAEDELAACEAAVKNGIPLALFADTFRSWARPWFEPYREAVSALFVVSPTEAEKARELFPNAKIVASGNPTWEGFFFPKYRRDEVRAKLEVGDVDSMILVPGSKSLAVNMLLFGGVIDAAIMLGEAYGQVFVSLHPGDKNPPKLYKELADYSPIPVKFVLRDFMSGSEMIPGADVVVESASTIGIEAACQRVPVVEYFTYAGRGNWKRQAGSVDYEPCELDIAVEASLDTRQFSEVLNLILAKGDEWDVCRIMLERQREVFPKPVERGVAVKVIVSTLRELCR